MSKQQIIELALYSSSTSHFCNTPLRYETDH